MRPLRYSVNVTLDGIHAAHVAGVLPSTQEAKLVPYINVVRAALDAGDAEYKTGDTSRVTVYLKAASAGLSRLADASK